MLTLKHLHKTDLATSICRRGAEKGNGDHEIDDETIGDVGRELDVVRSKRSVNLTP